MKTAFIILLTALIMGITGAQKAQASNESQFQYRFRLSVTNKDAGITGKIMFFHTMDLDYYTETFDPEECLNFSTVYTDYISKSHIYTEFHVTDDYNNHVYLMRITQESPTSSVLVEKQISSSQGYAYYFQPEINSPTDIVSVNIEFIKLW